MSAQGRTVVDSSDNISLLFLISSYEEFIFKQLTFFRTVSNFVSKFTKPCDRKGVFRSIRTAPPSPTSKVTNDNRSRGPSNTMTKSSDALMTRSLSAAVLGDE
jgi:hypothetical protein